MVPPIAAGNLGLVDGRQHGLYLGGTAGGNDHDNLRIFQEFLECRHGAGVGGLVVFENDRELAAVDPAGSVDLFNRQFCSLLVVLTRFSRFAGHGDDLADLDRLGLRLSDPE